MDRGQSRLDPRHSRLGSFIRRPGDGRVGGGHFSLDFRADQPEPHGRGRRKGELDLQISLLAEHEVTRLATLVSGIAERMGIETEADADLEEITRDVAPEAVLDELEAAEPEAEQR